jgi:hypothetical protein
MSKSYYSKFDPNRTTNVESKIENWLTDFDVTHYQLT